VSDLWWRTRQTIAGWLGLRNELPFLAGIRWRLTFWYTGVLTLALLIFGIVLYVGMQRTLIDPINGQLRNTALTLGTSVAPGEVCPDSHDLRLRLAFCYEVGHGLQSGDVYALQDPRLQDPSLINAAIHSGSASDTVDAGKPFGTTRLYAVVTFTDQQGNPLSVMQIAQPIGDQLNALTVLLHLLEGLGVLTLLLTAIGGIFLAGRALQPARLAYARQSAFIADASHELRTPLTILRADAEVLLRGRDRLPLEDAEILEDVVAEASHMASLANSMLNLARLDAGNVPIEQDVVDLAAIAQEIGRRIAPLAAERDVTVRVESDESVLVIGDRTLLEQTAIILADNATKYNRPGGEVRIRAAAHGERAILEVHDTGVGIAPEHLPRLGERFYRVDKARSREMGGAGLGISIARSIAARHGGTLELTSEPGQGTTATLVLPATHTVQRTLPEPEPMTDIARHLA
jgi:signal transduction histidine kinase